MWAASILAFSYAMILEQLFWLFQLDELDEVFSVFPKVYWQKGYMLCSGLTQRIWWRAVLKACSMDGQLFASGTTAKFDDMT